MAQAVIKSNLRDRVAFPPFSHLPNENDLDLTYYDDDETGVFSPIRHWAFLGEIIDVEIFIRVRLIVKDVDGRELPIAFYLDNDFELLPLRPLLKKGSTILIMYAESHSFLDMTVGIRQEKADTVQIIPTTLSKLLEINDAVVQKYPTQSSCDECGKGAPELKGSNLQTCGGCRGPKYCGQQCQMVAWKSVHKQDCKAVQQLKGLLVHDFSTFHGYLDI